MNRRRGAAKKTAAVLAVWILAILVWFPQKAAAEPAIKTKQAVKPETEQASKTRTAAKLGEVAEPTAAGSGAAMEAEFTTDDFDAGEIQRFLDGLSEGYGTGLTFRGVMREIADGNLEAVMGQAVSGLGSVLFREIRGNGALMGQIVILAVIGAVFSNFSGIFGSGHVSETGFYVVFLLIMTFLAASFYASVNVADRVSGELTGFMRVLLPAYFLAAAMAGGVLTSSAVCGFTLAAIGAVQAVLSGFLIPLMRVYMMLALAGNLYREDTVSRLTELMRQTMLWIMRTMFGVIVGFHLIQGLVLPQADALRNASAMRLAQMIPGVGAGAGAVSQIVMGSGILVKNTAGAAAVVILLLMAAVPMLKLLVLTVLYYIAAAVMQPVCDRRLVACVSEVAQGHAMLLKLVGYSLALFSVTVAILCVSTNAAWYAG